MSLPCCRRKTVNIDKVTWNIGSFFNIIVFCKSHRLEELLAIEINHSHY